MKSRAVPTVSEEVDIERKAPVSPPKNIHYSQSWANLHDVGVYPEVLEASDDSIDFKFQLVLDKELAVQEEKQQKKDAEIVNQIRRDHSSKEHAMQTRQRKQRSLSPVEVDRGR